MKTYTSKNFIKKVSIELYLEIDKNSILSLYESLRFLDALNQFNEKMKIQGNHLKFNLNKFKRYEITDHIDDLELCENYLSFCCAGFKKSPAMSMAIFFDNNYVKEIKFEGKEAMFNLNKFFQQLEFFIVSAESNFFN